MASTELINPGDERIPYAMPQAPFMQSDLLHPGVLSEWLADDRLWVPMTPTVTFKPCILSASNGYFVNVLRVRQNGILSRHRHAGAVHALVLRGRWHYLEHNWIAEQGSYVYEPPGDVHTLIVPDDVEEMITWFHNTGGYTYVDPNGFPVGYEDVFTKIEAAKKHYKAIGLGEDYVNRFIR
ncbi:MAG TPA: 2,4'-dihydroxyacetophenone dioxygenase family protein [Acidobacteriaceae bacterium]|nr:2,4'-dihydroxyacetophenone dioxygenase family protein [Acidobacteriaceae bacterium]